MPEKNTKNGRKEQQISAAAPKRDTADAAGASVPRDASSSERSTVTAALKPNDALKNDERKRQQAAKYSTSTPASKPRRQQPQQVHNSAKVGKANPKRDIPIFLGLVGLLFLIAYSFSGIGGADEVQKKKSVKQLQEDLRKQFEVAHAREQARKRTMECDLFIATSSIPGTGIGVFAGKRFEVDDEVVSVC